MKLLKVARASICTALAALFGGATFAAQATRVAEPALLTECLGYYTVRIPGEFEYALTENFSGGLGAWGTEIRLDLMGLQSQEVSISQPAGNVDLMRRMEARNAQQQREMDELLELAKRIDQRAAGSKEIDPDGQERKAQRDQANRISFVKRLSGREGTYFPTKDKIELHAIVNGHILSTTLPPQGTPEQTLDAFLSHYKPRALGEVPNGPGVCVPYGFFVGEQQPATIGLNIRLKEQPDIVVYLMAIDAATSQPWNPEEYIDRKTEPMSMFYASRGAVAMNRLRSYQRVSIDGQEGLGAFVNVKRDATLLQPVHNAATDSMDWGFLAYVPGKPGGKPGESFNITFKVERFGRFAKSPMTEKQFRELTQRIAASIKRRPGAWIPK